MQFQVPQFIEVEDKIFGPLTFRQFVYFVGGAGLSYVLYRYLPLFISGPLIMGLMGLSAMLALGKWNGRPVILGLEYGFYYLINSKLYLWSHERKEKQRAIEAAHTEVPAGPYVPQLSESKLNRLAWALDVQEKVEAASRLRAVPEKASEVVGGRSGTAREAYIQ